MSVPDADESARARDLAELGDYVRLLADRMGLKDWTFEVEWWGDGLSGNRIWLNDDRPRPPRHAMLGIPREFFEGSPEYRRFECARTLLQCYFEAHYEAVFRVDVEDDDAPEDDPGLVGSLLDGIESAAAAWAPCLPLPLVGLMRRAPLRADEAGGEKEGATR